MLAVLALWSCSGGGPGAGGGGGTGGSGGGGGGDQGAFAITVLDANARDPEALAMAVDPVTERVGVVYFTNKGTTSTNPDGGSGIPDYELKYVEYQGGITLGPETIRTVQRREGLALTFDPVNGEPVASYLGGQKDLNVSIYWFQHDAVVARRHGGAWTETVVASNSADIPCGNNVSDTGMVLGHWPALGWDSAGTLVLAFRDVHQGQFPMQDWGGSDVKVVSMAPTAPAGTRTSTCAKAGGKDKEGWGGHLKMVGTSTQPAIVYDEMPQDAETGQKVVFQQRLPGGAWGGAEIPLAIANTQSGPSLAWDSTEGFGIAVFDANTSKLGYIYKRVGMPTWSALDPVFGAGSGGWYPTLAIAPDTHEPSIAFYVCSPISGRNPTQCSTDTNELRVTQRTPSRWLETLVDPEGGYLPQLAFFSGGRRVIAYRQPVARDPGTGNLVAGAGILKLAVER
jgi:hypothetical protein